MGWPARGRSLLVRPASGMGKNQASKKSQMTAEPLDNKLPRQKENEKQNPQDKTHTDPKPNQKRASDDGLELVSCRDEAGRAALDGDCAPWMQQAENLVGQLRLLTRCRVPAPRRARPDRAHPVTHQPRHFSETQRPTPQPPLFNPSFWTCPIWSSASSSLGISLNSSGDLALVDRLPGSSVV